ncbi:hypothetical protein ACFL59_09205 [Planctomycetota bacterium]
MSAVPNPISSNVLRDPVFADVVRDPIFAGFSANGGDELDAEKAPSTPGVYRSFGELSDEDIVDEEGLARIFDKCRKSIKRAVGRGELPAPFRFGGQPTWRVGSIREHFAKAEAKAEKEAARRARLIERHSLR